jgi:hypothetical protein
MFHIKKHRNFVFRYSLAKGIWNLMRLNLMLEFIQNIGETLLSSKFPMKQFCNPKDSYLIFLFNSSIFHLQFLCSKGPLNGYCKPRNLITDVLITDGFVAENPNPHLHKHKIISREFDTELGPINLHFTINKKVH